MYIDSLGDDSQFKMGYGYFHASFLLLFWIFYRILVTTCWNMK